MLTQLLRVISSQKGLVALPSLARELGISEGLLDRMVEDAVRLGYLVALSGGCAGVACSACRHGSSCCGSPSSRAWSLTEKGQRLLEMGSREGRSPTRLLGQSGDGTDR